MLYTTLPWALKKADIAVAESQAEAWAICFESMGATSIFDPLSMISTSWTDQSLGP